MSDFNDLSWKQLHFERKKRRDDIYDLRGQKFKLEGQLRNVQRQQDRMWERHVRTREVIDADGSAQANSLMREINTVEVRIATLQDEVREIERVIESKKY